MTGGLSLCYVISRALRSSRATIKDAGYALIERPSDSPTFHSLGWDCYNRGSSAHLALLNCWPCSINVEASSNRMSLLGFGEKQKTDSISATAPEEFAARVAHLDPIQLPRHIAIIMDGNGRWARKQGWPRIEGHRRGVQSVRIIVEEAVRLGIGQLTLYCFSSENWKRPKTEFEFLMSLLRHFLVQERKLIVDQNIRFSTIGEVDQLGPAVVSEVEKTRSMTAQNTGMKLCLALNYGSRQEIVNAVRSIATRVQAGELAPNDIHEESITSSLQTAGMVDPDLLIRTAGEMRISNYLLWQISYAEIYVTQRFWPEFRVPDFHQALLEYASRERRFGGLKDRPTDPPASAEPSVNTSSSENISS